MIIKLDKPMFDSRCSRVVIGRPKSMDISCIFEEETRDSLTNELITHENFDNDDVYYIDSLGYTRRKSLVEAGYGTIECESAFETITEDQLK